uniref:Uncharacterized protein n=1 Tax=Anopheles darlingi TaxID=43151 RepID=A0A2M4DLA9_ANODA
MHATAHFRGCWMWLTGFWCTAAGGFWAWATCDASTEWSALFELGAAWATSPVLTFGAGFESPITSTGSLAGLSLLGVLCCTIRMPPAFTAGSRPATSSLSSSAIFSDLATCCYVRLR